MTLSQNISGVSIVRAIAHPAGPCDTHPWCFINHTDHVFSEDCHVGDIDWTSGLGLGLGTSDGAPVAVQASWDYANDPEFVTWTPAQARQVAIALLQLADIAEKPAVAK